MFMLGSLFEAALLLVNAVAILQDTTPSLHEGRPPVKRFLAKMGWTHAEDETSVKGKIITMINAVRTLMRLPLIFVNLLVAVYLILAG
ncbi:hypothetical protein PTSG_08217 [Salpingoeca rosetta]|uniref:Immediate early response 3-interacting protein 1 n=1 Tax=Salpingoeca rosetta (strain ATCC 50818 / BSB-021) TaxID=946362 RepID=F2UIC0_SALR5|nr:uncharacterized protein PTSG_08217 [Salpingoeca rosetta]EGD76869.1 hypothetical protein PTSG_08217 [Salpingoeca rosetta]|eukprot:XP_004991241.1 hypothetical protein PTSG_08217 [Salpingoeca rosetta]